MSKKLLFLPGDGIGKEVSNEAFKLLNHINKKFNTEIEIINEDVGGESIKKNGIPIKEEIINQLSSYDAVFLGAVGDPKYDHLPLENRPEAALLKIRKILNCFANLRPIWLPESLKKNVPIKDKYVEDGVDILIIRELLNGLYFGPKGRKKLENGEDEAFDTAVYSQSNVQDVARLAFKYASKRKKKLLSVDKSNILETSKLWREEVDKISKKYPDIHLSHQLVDSMAMILLLKPSTFDVILMNNEFGDILSDEAALLSGSIGMIPSAAIGLSKPYFYEPIHGSAPDIAGQGIANPLGAILTVGMIFEYSFEMDNISNQIRKAVEATLLQGFRTKEICGEGDTLLNTEQMGDKVIENL